VSLKRVLACLVAAGSVGALPAAAAQTDERPDGTIELMGGSLAVGIGIDWASGTLTYQGREIPVDLHGISIARIGANNFWAKGEVYNLHDLSDFAGKYGVVSAGGALLHGGSAMAMRNENGVVIRMTSSSGGLDIDFGVKALAMSLR
jgi:hypothetical protein